MDNNQLQKEIDKARAEIRSDNYSMSIGEWLSLYQIQEGQELDIHPEYQRNFRWDVERKSRFIESILLGIPIPSIFVNQQESGLWDVIDGVQRLSTIYELAGILRDENDQVLSPLVLQKTKYLPSLEGKKWLDEDNPQVSLTMAQRLLIKRAKINVNIILRESDSIAKYELFERLNTGGLELSNQEIRNSILVKINPNIYHGIRKLSENEHFLECIRFTEKQISEQYPMELILRFIIFRTLSEDELKKINSYEFYLTQKMEDFIKNQKIDMQEETKAFELTFAVLHEAIGKDSFRKYLPEQDKFQGKFLLSAYEVIALGIGYNYDNLSLTKTKLKEKVKELWKDKSDIFKGTRTHERVKNTIPQGRLFFKS